LAQKARSPQGSGFLFLPVFLRNLQEKRRLLLSLAKPLIRQRPNNFYNIKNFSSSYLNHILSFGVAIASLWGSAVHATQ